MDRYVKILWAVVLTAAAFTVVVAFGATAFILIYSLYRALP